MVVVILILSLIHIQNMASELVRTYTKNIKVYVDRFNVTFKSEMSVNVERAS